VKKVIKLAVRIARSHYRTFREDGGYYLGLFEKNRYEKCGELRIQVSGDYLISSEKGVYRLCPEGMFHVSRRPAFGISVIGDDVYIASWLKNTTVILRGRRGALTQPKKSFEWEEIYSQNTLSPAGRIHQITAYGDALWISNTAKNSFTKINRYTGKWMGNICPFRCSFGHPISGDHNHVNGVFPQEKYLMFTAFKANRESVLGIVGDGKVKIYTWSNMGIHDCYFAGDELWFSDSYRMWDGKPGGAIVRNGKYFDEKYFINHPSEFVRGIAEDKKETLFGSSFAGSREARFDGKGEILIAKEGRVVERTYVPFAQVYDIIRMSGEHSDKPVAPTNFDSASALLDKYLGVPVEEMSLLDAVVGENAKKFSADDVGEIKEYL